MTEKATQQTSVSDATQWVTVPRDASDEMIAAALAVDWGYEDEAGTVHNVWHAMVSASPTPPSVPVGDAETLDQYYIIPKEMTDNEWGEVKYTVDRKADPDIPLWRIQEAIKAAAFETIHRTRAALVSAVPQTEEAASVEHRYDPISGKMRYYGSSAPNGWIGDDATPATEPATEPAIIAELQAKVDRMTEALEGLGKSKEYTRLLFCIEGVNNGDTQEDRLIWVGDVEKALQDFCALARAALSDGRRD